MTYITLLIRWHHLWVTFTFCLIFSSLCRVSYKNGSLICLKVTNCFKKHIFILVLSWIFPVLAGAHGKYLKFNQQKLWKLCQLLLISYLKWGNSETVFSRLTVKYNKTNLIGSLNYTKIGDENYKKCKQFWVVSMLTLTGFHLRFLLFVKNPPQ